MGLQNFYRDSWVEINLDFIEYNIKQLRERIGKEKGIYAVVKANAYGHGYKQVAEAALQAGASGLAVAFLDEALHLRQQGVQAAILVLGATRPEDAPIAADHDISLTFYRADWLEAVRSLPMKKPLHLHLKWDTGMGRLGIRSIAELDEILPLLRVPSVKLEGIFTHFATADELDLHYYHNQEHNFEEMLTAFRERWQEPVIVHAENSAASMRFNLDSTDFVRFGISMYGLYPSLDVKDEKPMELREAFSLHSKLVHIKQLPKNQGISYGATYHTEKNEWIGTIPIGYADGWIRKMQGFQVLVNGKRMPIVGRVCMDQCMIKLDQEYPVGTKVVLIGEQDGERISVDDAAVWADTINYEVPCLIAARIPRVYKRNGQITEVSNSIIDREK